MKMPDGSDAELHYFQRVVEDCERVLGPGIELRGLEFDANGEVVPAAVATAGAFAAWTSEGHGETVIAAHAALREQLVLDRIRLGVRAMYTASR